MKRLATIAFACLVLAGCGKSSDTTTSKIDQIRAYADNFCGVLPSVPSITALINSGAVSAVSSAVAIGTMVCNAYKAHVETAHAAPQGLTSEVGEMDVNTQTGVVKPGAEPNASQDCPKVAGVCVWAEKVDRQKLDAYQPKTAPVETPKQ